jgi:molybdopterin-guanine dinucleotide biosynthesis protein A
MTGLLLAGGRSRRMGTDKALVEFHGARLAERGLRILRSVCDDVVVASGDGSRLASLGAPQVADAAPDSGPLGGIVAGLEAAATDLVAVVAVDMPFASAGVLRLLAGRWSGEDAAVPVTDRGPEPLHAVYARSAAPALRRLLESGVLAMNRVLELIDTLGVEEREWRAADPSGRFALNVNRPEDLEIL